MLLGKEGLGIYQLSPIFPLQEGSAPWAVAEWRQCLPARPLPVALNGGLGQGKGPSVAEPGELPGHVWSYSPQLPLHGAVSLEARNVWARLAQGRGHAWFCLWPVGHLSRTGPLPMEDLPACFQRLVFKHSCRLFPQATNSALKPWTKALWGGPVSGPMALSLGNS